MVLVLSFRELLKIGTVMLVDTIFYSGFILVSLAAKRNSRKRGDIEYQNSPIM